MKKMLVLIIILFSQVFFGSENARCSNLNPLEDTKGNLWPAPDCDRP